MAIDLPTFLPDGSTLLQDHDFVTRLKAGDPTIGWLGDERLGVYFDADCLVIRRLCEDGELRDICRSKPGVRYLNTETLKFLAAHDGRGAGHDVVERVIAQNQAVEAEQDAKFKEFCDETADRMEFAMMKDIGRTEGSGLSKRLYTVGSIKKDDSQ
jgi:hypothetical protein